MSTLSTVHDMSVNVIEKEKFGYALLSKINYQIYVRMVMMRPNSNEIYTCVLFDARHKLFVFTICYLKHKLILRLPALTTLCIHYVNAAMHPRLLQTGSLPANIQMATFLVCLKNIQMFNNSQITEVPNIQAIETGRV